MGKEKKEGGAGGGGGGRWWRRRRRDCFWKRGNLEIKVCLRKNNIAFQNSRDVMLENWGLPL